MEASTSSKSKIVMIGDVGGTNVRLQLIGLSGPTLEETKVVKDLDKYNTQEANSLIDCVKKYLQDVAHENFPEVGVVGMAGPVVENTIQAVNISHWGKTDGNQIAKEMGFKSFLFINDFTAAGYGISRVKESDCKALGCDTDSARIPLEEGANSVKVVIGPGTGLGQGILIKKEEDGFYDPIPSEGGHVDFTVITEDDWELAQFARNFIENSNNVENLRGKGKIGRLSVERLCAGPAVPLIYCYMKQKHPYYEAVLEKETEYGPAKHFDNLESADIIRMGMDNADPLCLKVIEKFTEIFGTETGNLALKTLPTGGIYLIGGVTNGIQDYLLNTPTFMDAFSNKGRLEYFMKNKFKVLLVNPKIEIGLLGAEEKARREVL